MKPNSGRGNFPPVRLSRSACSSTCRVPSSIIDAFDGAVVDAELVGRRSLEALRRCMTRGGAVALNTIGSLTEDSNVRTTITTMRQVFAEVRVLPVCGREEDFDPRALRNVVLVGTCRD